jgi:predicted nucleic acid-binding protein
LRAVSLVVADTGPLRYLVLIDANDVLPRLLGRVLIPEIVGAELSRLSTPFPVREWLAAGPTWLERRANPTAREILPPQLGAGERAAIGLAQRSETPCF